MSNIELAKKIRKREKLRDALNKMLVGTNAATAYPIAKKQEACQSEK